MSILKKSGSRCAPRVLAIALIVLLGLLAVRLNSRLVISFSSKPALHSVKRIALDGPPVDVEKLQLIQTLNDIAQNTSQSRGIVIPVYEYAALIAASLILELRTMGVGYPIELPHCGDLLPESQALLMQKSALGSIRIYDFQTFDVKILSVIFSKFEEVMMTDVDTAYFVNPTVLWDSKKYKETGILLMNDRTAHEKYYMAERVDGSGNQSVQHLYMAKFDPAPFRVIPTLQREEATLPNLAPVKLQFEPSDNLLNSHSWNLRTGHQVDSSLVFWNKKKQPRATAILASFKSLSDVGSPPSYGDKELYFYAAELAETQYSISDHAIAAVGTDYQGHGEKNSTLCGDMAQVFPIKQDTLDNVPLFYLNSDHVLYFEPEVEPVYYPKARMADDYLGSFGTRPINCAFGITGIMFSKAEARHLTGRQRLYQLVVDWKGLLQGDANDSIQQKSVASLDSMMDEQMRIMREDYRQVNIPKV